MAKMTLEKLARMVAGGFKKVDERFDGVDERFDQLEKRMDTTEAEVKGLREDMANWRVVSKDHERRIDRIETKMEIVN